MVVKIRLARFGKKHAPFYNIVVANARTARNSRPIEVLGTYDPIPRPPPEGKPDRTLPYKDIQLDMTRARYWLGVGAQPSEPAWRLLSLVGLIEPQYKLARRTGDLGAGMQGVVGGGRGTGGKGAWEKTGKVVLKGERGGEVLEAEVAERGEEKVEV